jgi:hypothetical protein
LHPNNPPLILSGIKYNFPEHNIPIINNKKSIQFVCKI